MTRPQVRPPEVTAARDVLLATKLRPPRARAGWVARPRLVERLRDGTGGELVLVCGPAGFGKSSLLADWMRADERPVAWLSLDAGDNDPVRFWRQVIAALDTVRPGVAEQVGAIVGTVTSESFRAGLQALVDALATWADDVALVVDDYHVIDSSEIHGSMEFLLDHLPPSLHLVLSSRTDPPLPLARLRVRGQVTELRADELRFTSDEAAELLRAAVGHDLPDGVVTALEQRTEGWAAGLHLAALSLRGRADVNGFVDKFSGSHRFVLDYLTQEVLERQTPELRTFLLETSLLDRLSGPLCDAVVGRTDSQQLLESVEQANLFLIPLDTERCWWRYHHLFADLLRATLLRLEPARVPELHHAAARWYEQCRLPDDAVRHALAAGDTAWAADIVAAHYEEQVLQRGEGATANSWLAALPAEAIRRRPRLTLGQAYAHLTAYLLDEAEPLLEVVAAALEGVDDEPYRPSIDRRDSVEANIPAALAVARAHLAPARGDADGERVFALDALAHMTEQDELLSHLARYHVASADWLAGDVAAAESGLAGIVAEQLTSTRAGRVMLSRPAFDLGGLQLAQGRLRAAERTLRQALEAAGTGPTAGVAHIGLAEVYYRRDELAAAAEHAVIGIELCRRLAFAWALVAGLTTLARVRRAEGDPTGALAALAEAERAMPAGVVDVRNSLPALRAWWAFADGNLAEVAIWVHRRGLRAEDEPSITDETDYQVLARVLLAGQNPEPAVALLARLRASAVAQQRFGSELRAAVPLSLAYDAIGDRAAALTTMAEALALAAPEGYLRVFLDEGALLAPLLRELVVNRRLQHLGTNPVSQQFVARLAAAFDVEDVAVLPPVRVGTAAAPGLLQPLSPRELEVLTLLSAGHPNKAIAQSLFITVDTVKRHVSHIFDKLGVGNRTQAVAQARDLGLLA